MGIDDRGAVLLTRHSEDAEDANLHGATARKTRGKIGRLRSFMLIDAPINVR